MNRLLSLFAGVLFVVLPMGSIQAQLSAVSYPSFAFEMPDQEYRLVVESRGQKIEVHPEVSSLNGELISVERLRVRGKSTLHFPKKSFSVRLAKGTSLELPGCPEKIAKKFYLMSLSLDLYYFHNRLSFLLMEELGIFPLYNSFAEVSINGESQGIYLILEHPEQHFLKQQKADLILRRGTAENVDEYDTRKGLSAKETKSYLKQFQSIEKICKSKRGEALYQELSQLVDLEAYMKWLAFNYWTANGDYEDEVFFYSLSREAPSRFSILPWDYDDIFAEAPHEGWEVRDNHIGTAMIFSSEDILGRTIANDPYLYQQYLAVLSDMLHHFSEQQLEDLFQQVEQELAPFMDLKDFVEVNPYDEEKRTRAEIIRQKLAEKEVYLKERRTEFLSRL